MSTIRIEFLDGTDAGRVLEPEGDVVRIGRASSNELRLAAHHVSSEHARVVIGVDKVLLEDLHSTNGTAVVRGAERIVLGEEGSPRLPLESGDIIELGGEGDESTRLSVTLGEEREIGQVVSVRPIGELVGYTESVERNTDVLKTLYQVEKQIGGADDLDGVLVALADAALVLVPRATHVTIVLRDEPDGEDAGTDEAGYVPVLTRVRGQKAEASLRKGLCRSRAAYSARW